MQWLGARKVSELHSPPSSDAESFGPISPIGHRLSVPTSLRRRFFYDFSSTHDYHHNMIRRGSVPGVRVCLRAVGIQSALMHAAQPPMHALCWYTQVVPASLIALYTAMEVVPQALHTVFLSVQHTLWCACSTWHVEMARWKAQFLLCSSLFSDSLLLCSAAHCLLATKVTCCQLIRGATPGDNQPTRATCAICAMCHAVHTVFDLFTVHATFSLTLIFVKHARCQILTSVAGLGASDLFDKHCTK